MEAGQQKTRETCTQYRSISNQTIGKLAALPLISLIRIYQWCISPMLGPHCRFQPSCSAYAIGCLHTHGLLRGIWLSLNRIRKCHPWHEGGSDPVPPKHSDSVQLNGK